MFQSSGAGGFGRGGGGGFGRGGGGGGGGWPAMRWAESDLPNRSRGNPERREKMLREGRLHAC